MHIFFSGIGGAGIGPLALIARQAGYEVSGSDLKEGDYVKFLRQNGISNIEIGQSRDHIAKVHDQKTIDWLVYSSALPRTDPNHPELKFAEEKNIKSTKREDLINKIMEDSGQSMIAVAGTHGKTTTTAMVVWVFKQLELLISYSVGAKLSFGLPGEFNPNAKYFAYEADEYDNNFLAYHPALSLITGIDWDHPDVFPTRDEYYKAFHQFLSQSQKAVVWQSDIERLNLKDSDSVMVLDEKDVGVEGIKLGGLVNRQNAWQVAKALQPVVDKPLEELLEIMDRFPGLSRRFEEIAPKLYSDYAHTPGKIRGALQMAQEVAGDNVVVIYEGLHNLRQHFIKDELAELFDDVKHLYIVPSYLGREDPSQKLLSPTDLLNMLSKLSNNHAQAAELNDELKQAIEKHQAAGDLVLCLTAGGPGSLDEWLRHQFKQ